MRVEGSTDEFTNYANYTETSPYSVEYTNTNYNNYLLGVEAADIVKRNGNYTNYSGIYQAESDRKKDWIATEYFNVVTTF